jgi:chromosomal replication initiation ATPase DnaA
MTIKTPQQLEEGLTFYLEQQPLGIIEQIADYYQIDKKDLIDSKTRQKEYIANARQVCQYIIRKKTNLTLKQIAYIFDRKHTTIIHAIKKVEAQMSNKLDNRMRNDVNKLNDIIKINYHEAI